MMDKFLKRIKKCKRRTLYCVIGGIVFGIISFLFNQTSIYINGNEIERGTYGTQRKSYKIKIDVDNIGKNIETNIQVSPKKYTKKEADKVFDEKIEGLKLTILNDNAEFNRVNKKLNFPSNMGDGVNVAYTFFPHFIHGISTISDINMASSSNIDFSYHVKYQKLIDGSGNVFNDDFDENEFCNGNIEIQFSTEVKGYEGLYKSDKYLIPITIVAKELDEYDSFINNYQKEVKNIDEKTTNDDTIALPKIINEHSISYKDRLNMNFLVFPILGIIISLLLNASDKEKKKEIEKKIKRNLELDFSQIISKILLYVSSGMTIRNSFMRLAEIYKNKLDKQLIEQRKAYDELLIVRNKLSSGYNEIKSYEEMAEHLNMRMYTRFLNIIIQSIKNGNKDLKNILNMEVQDALYERKQKAKKLGEEATTKLVLPLMMMLAVIMVIIMVPAFMGM